VVAEFALIQFKTVAGSAAVGSGALNPDSSGLPAFAFFGQEGNIGYVSSPTAGNALAYPVSAGRTSWEVWLAARFNGFAFGAITGVTWFIDTIATAGLGTMASTLGYEVPRGTSLMDRTGVVGRVHAGPIEKNVSPLDPANFVPASAPRYGLPVSEDAIPLMQPGILNGLDLTPLQASDDEPDPGSGDEFGERVILEANLEPRYSNLAVMTLVLASDATPVAITRNPFLFGATWMES